MIDPIILEKNWAIIPQSYDKNVFQIVYRRSYNDFTIITFIIEEITDRNVIIWAIRYDSHSRNGITLWKREIIPKTRFRLAIVNQPPYSFLLVRHGTYRWQLTYQMDFSMDAESVEGIKIIDFLPLLEKAKIVRLDELSKFDDLRL